MSLSIMIGFKTPNTRCEKGKSLISIPSNYVVIDLETTGLSPDFDEILELAAIRVRDGHIVASFDSLVSYDGFCGVDPFITELTGITTEMIESAPRIEKVLPDYIRFIGSDIIIGHNVNFDINFLYDSCINYLSEPLRNDFVDTMRLSRRLNPKERHHRLSDLVERYNIPQNGFHRALMDCETTFLAYNAISNEISEKYSNVEDFIKIAYGSYNAKTANITGDPSKADSSSPFYQRVCVVTGKLERYTWQEVMQLIADIGGINSDSVTKKTDYLILGNNDYCSIIKNGKSNKQKKAEELILKGYDITILSESSFYEMISDEL